MPAWYGGGGRLGRIRGVQLHRLMKGRTTVVARLSLRDGRSVRWEVDDKRLLDLTLSLSPFVGAGEALGVLYGCVGPGRRAALSRWRDRA